MDKLTRTLSVVEDHSAKLKILDGMIARFAKTLALVGTASGGVTSFGSVSVTSPSAVIVTFDGAAGTLSFGGVRVAYGESPLVGILDAKEGELALDIEVPATALVMGNASIKTNK